MTFLPSCYCCAISSSAKSMPSSKRDSTATKSQVIRDDSKNIKQLLAEAVELLKQEHKNEITALKVEIVDIKASQAFISKKYEDLSVEHQKLLQTNAQQKKRNFYFEISRSSFRKSRLQKNKKIDWLEQYGRRKNLEIAGVTQQPNENTNSLVIEVARLLNVVMPPDHIPTSHRLPKKPNHSTKDSVCPPSIIVRNTNRDTRNKMFANRKFICNLDLKQFSVPETEKIFINENLTQTRKKLFWQIKQKAKKEEWKYYWTVIGNIFVKKHDEVACNINKKMYKIYNQLNKTQIFAT